jgi:hypothetical protein
MPEVTLTHNYPNGSVLSASGHGDNLYSDTAEEGLYSVVNGSLSGVGAGGNFASGFTHAPEHVAPGEIVMLGGEIHKRTQRAFSATLTGNDENEPVCMGFGARIRLPWQPAYLRVSYAFHAAAWRLVAMEQGYQYVAPSAGPPATPADALGDFIFQRAAGANMYLDVYWNGTLLEAHRIKFGASAHVEVINGVGTAPETRETRGGRISNYEDVRAHSHAGAFVVPGGVSAGQAKAGMNTLEFRAFIQQPLGDDWAGSQNTDKYTAVIRQAIVKEAATVALYPRLTIGHRSVSYLAIGSPAS